MSLAPQMCNANPAGMGVLSGSAAAGEPKGPVLVALALITPISGIMPPP
jgi:hypothetical protein